MKYIKKFEHYNSPNMDKISDEELRTMSIPNIKTKDFTHQNIDKGDRINYTEEIKKIAYKVIPELEKFEVRSSDHGNNTSTLHFIANKSFMGKSFIANIDLVIFHQLKKIKISLECGINVDEEDEYGIQGHELDVTEDSKFLEDVFYFNHGIHLYDIQKHLGIIGDKLYIYHNYVNEKYGVAPF